MSPDNTAGARKNQTGQQFSRINGQTTAKILRSRTSSHGAEQTQATTENGTVKKEHLAYVPTFDSTIKFASP